MPADVFAFLCSTLQVLDYDDYAVGIDLGTTKSCLATAGNDGEEIYCEASPINEEGQPEGEIAMPSVVALTEDRVVVGHAARRLARRKGYANGYRSFSEAKNEMGLRCHYPMAPTGFRTATDIACVLIDQLVVGSSIGDRPNAAHWVIAVPASFHGAQRRATLYAALSTELMDEDSLSLIDEPYAALLDLLFRRPDALDRLRRGGVCLVFDFGGGTCDVAVFDLADDGEALAPRLRATSRYHRIGGGDIDRAIVHGHLLPALLERYGLDRSEVSFRDKRDLFEPVLRGVAATRLGAAQGSVAERVGRLGHGGPRYSHLGMYPQIPPTVSGCNGMGWDVQKQKTRVRARVSGVSSNWVELVETGRWCPGEDARAPNGPPTLQPRLTQKSRCEAP